MSMSVSDVPVFGVIADECALALESMFVRKEAIAWLGLVSIIPVPYTHQKLASKK